MEANEREQYRAAIHGDRDAFEMIILSQSRTLFAIAYGILQNRQEAEDAVQDSLLKAWKSRRRVREVEKFPAWLATITRHTAQDRLRKRPQNALEPETIVAESEAGIWAEMEHSIAAAMATLPEIYRAALTLRYFEDKDYQAIENTLGLTNGALRGILGRALAAMRKQLRPALASRE